MEHLEVAPRIIRKLKLRQSELRQGITSASSTTAYAGGAPARARSPVTPWVDDVIAGMGILRLRLRQDQQVPEWDGLWPLLAKRPFDTVELATRDSPTRQCVRRSGFSG